MEINLSKYSGVWYEICKIPLKWEKNCQQSVAIYKFDKASQKMLVENQCYRNGVMIESRRATAWVPDPKHSNQLLINFDDGLPADPGPSPYWILWTDYENAIVGGPSKQFLWWLSRKPTVKAREVEPMLRKIRSFGYDTNQLLTDKSVVEK